MNFTGNETFFKDDYFSYSVLLYYLICYATFLLFTNIAGSNLWVHSYNT